MIYGYDIERANYSNVEFFRQSLRETWANGTEFNYSKFSKIHAHLKDQYLQFDDPKWMQFVKKDSKDATIVGAKVFKSTK